MFRGVVLSPFSVDKSVHNRFLVTEWSLRIKRLGSSAAFLIRFAASALQ